MDKSSIIIISTLFILVIGIIIYFTKKKTDTSLPQTNDKEEKIETPSVKNRIGKKVKILCRYENLISEEYDRYILVRGENLKSVESIIAEYGELSAKVNPYTYRFSKAKLGDWTIIKIPSDFQDNYSYHNMIYWFLGHPETDNFASEAIGLSLADDISYVLYGNYDINKILKLEDYLFGSFSESEEKFMIYVPSNEFSRLAESKHTQTFHKLLENSNIDIKKIDSDTISYTPFEVLFNEK